MWAPIGDKEFLHGQGLEVGQIVRRVPPDEPGLPVLKQVGSVLDRHRSRLGVQGGDLGSLLGAEDRHRDDGHPVHPFRPSDSDSYRLHRAGVDPEDVEGVPPGLVNYRDGGLGIGLDSRFGGSRVGEAVADPVRRHGRATDPLHQRFEHAPTPGRLVEEQQRVPLPGGGPHMNLAVRGIDDAAVNGHRGSRTLPNDPTRVSNPPLVAGADWIGLEAIPRPHRYPN